MYRQDVYSQDSIDCQVAGHLSLTEGNCAWRQTATLTREKEYKDYSEVILHGNSVPDFNNWPKRNTKITVKWSYMATQSRTCTVGLDYCTDWLPTYASMMN